MPRYAAPTERVGRRRSSVSAVAVAVAVVGALIVLGAIVGNQLRESQGLAPGRHCGAEQLRARTCQLDAAGRLVGVSKDGTTILAYRGDVRLPGSAEVRGRWATFY